MTRYLLSILLLAALSFTSCKKDEPCSGVTIDATAMITGSAPSTPTGKIIVNASGSSDYTYSLDGGAFQSSNEFLNVAAGSHTVVVKDKNGCAKTLAVVVPNACEGTTLAVTTQAYASSPSTPNGRIVVTVTGPGTPYEYKLDNGSFQMSNEFLNVSAGAHTITVRNANNCTNTVNVTVPATVTPTVANIAGTYVISKFTVQAGTGAETDITNSIVPCERDDRFIFNTNMTMLYQDAGVVCMPDGTYNSTWSLPSSTTMVVDGELYNIRYFDGTRLELTIASGGYTYIYYLTK